LNLISRHATFIQDRSPKTQAGAHDIPAVVPAGCFAFFLVLYTIYKLIFPLRTRAPLWGAIWEVVTAPYTSPTFFTIYVADVFTSMVKVFQDIAWSLGFVISGDFLLSEDKHRSMVHAWSQSFWYKNVLIPLICLFPLWLRFNQCLRRYVDTGSRMPNLANALKYAMSQTVTLFGAFHPLYLMRKSSNVKEPAFNYFQVFWIILFVSSSLYSFWWDVVMDWGLGRRDYQFLGPRLMYPHRSTYYAVIAADLVLRFMWVLTLIPPQSGAIFALPQYLTAVTMGLELTRRTMWGFFRLENEHRSNTDHYRRVSFVPLHFNTGHKHTYNREKEHKGSTVLVEVAFVTLLVIGVSATSVIAAQRASHNYPEL
jgi:xenotropic and polytropic retrovirus receptor 1